MTGPSLASTEAFTPKLMTAFREGYGRSDLRADVLAGLTVAIVALPLAMALGIASGASPREGLVTAIIAGLLISALGGSRVQIGGPTGAFVVIVAGVIAAHGFSGGAKEVRAAAPAALVSELEPGLMHKRCGLEGLAGSLAG